MDLTFDIKLIEKYSNNSQKARVLTEDWVHAMHFVQFVEENEYKNIFLLQVLL